KMKSKTSFRLPPDVSFEKQRLSNAWAYVFRHRLLGEIGRILLQELGDGRCHISCEVVGDPSDPLTTQREAIFNPLGLELTRQMTRSMRAFWLASWPLLSSARAISGARSDSAIASRKTVSTSGWQTVFKIDTPNSTSNVASASWVSGTGVVLSKGRRIRCARSLM